MDTQKGDNATIWPFFFQKISLSDKVPVSNTRAPVSTPLSFILYTTFEIIYDIVCRLYNKFDGLSLRCIIYCHHIDMTMIIITESDNLNGINYSYVNILDEI